MYKHSLWSKWTHWINFPLLSLMIWSGTLIYWANPAYWPNIPEAVYRALHINGRLAEGLSYHFFFMWLFTINGIIFVGYLLISGEWREMFPNRRTLAEAWQVVLHDLKIRKEPLPEAKFNGAQRIAYSGVLLMGVGSILTGLAIFKPIQLNLLTSFLGGYESARLIHYLLTAGYILFFFMHIFQVIRAGWNNFRAMVSVAALIVVALFGIAFANVSKQEKENGLPVLFRRSHQTNEKIWSKLVSTQRKDPVQISIPQGKPARINGMIGLRSSMDISNWKLQVFVPEGDEAKEILSLTLEDLKKLPRTEVSNEFKCIEGWSEPMSFAGVRFQDFLQHYGLNQEYQYVGLETPDGEYYVSVDMKSMLSEQTLLAYEMNGAPLTEEHGAPLRLAIPNKYGVKNLKRIGSIEFSHEPLPDYWGEAGYDWFLGL